MKRISIVFATLILAVIFSVSAFAQKSLVERTAEVESKEKNPVAARQEMVQDATEKISEALIKEIIGEPKYNRNKSTILNKVIKQSARFVPYSKPAELVPMEAEGFKMALTIKVSIDDLQTVLLENGLFYETDGTPIVLPAIRFIDRVNGRSHFWWSGIETKSGPLVRQGKRFEESLRSAFGKNSFYSLRPQMFRMGQMLPEILRTETVRPDDWQNISQKLGAQILIDGEVQFNKSQERSDAFTISIKMAAIQVVNGRIIAEVARQYETDGGNFDLMIDRKLKENMDSVAADLSNQVLEAWQKGAIGASLYRLAIKGRLPLLQQETFKEALKSKVREVKNVTERLISEDEVIYEVDSALGPKDLGQRLPKFEVGSMQLVLESASDTGVVYKLNRAN